MDAVRAATKVVQSHADAALAASETRDRVLSLVLLLVSIASALAAVGLLGRLALVRRRVEQRTAALLDGVFANAPVGLGFLDRDLTIQHMNRALATMNARGFGADLGAPIWASVPTLQEQLIPKLKAARDEGLVTTNVDVAVPTPSAPRGVRHFQMSFYPLRGRTTGSDVQPTASAWWSRTRPCASSPRSACATARSASARSPRPPPPSSGPRTRKAASR